MDKRLFALALGTFAIGTDSYVVAGILPRVADTFGVGVSAAGQFVTIYSLTYALLTPVMATLTAHWPRRRVLLTGMIVFAIGNILTATGGLFELALLGRAIAGLGGAMFTPAASAIAMAMVPPERRGRALAVVLAGLSAATALGAPIGTIVGNASDWQTTMWAVTALGTASFLGILAVLPQVAGTTPLRLRERLAPLADARVAVTLLTTLLFMIGVFLVYTYISVVFDRATAGDGALVAALMSTWGAAAFMGSLGAGNLLDRFGSRRIINISLIVVAVDFAFMPWTGATIYSALIALAVWGFCGWGLVVALQHRLAGIDSTLAPILLALNASAIYSGVSISGAAGALAISHFDPHRMPFFSAILILGALACAERAYYLIRREIATVRP